MILKIKSYLHQIYRIIFLLFLINISNLYAHNLPNGGCKKHCVKKIKSIDKEKKLNNDQFDIDSKNSCLNKSLCRG